MLIIENDLLTTFLTSCWNQTFNHKVQNTLNLLFSFSLWELFAFIKQLKLPD